MKMDEKRSNIKKSKRRYLIISILMYMIDFALLLLIIILPAPILEKLATTVAIVGISICGAVEDFIELQTLDEKRSNIKKNTIRDYIISILMHMTVCTILFLIIISPALISEKLAATAAIIGICICDAFRDFLVLQILTDIYIDDKKVTFLKLSGKTIVTDLDQVVELKYGIFGQYVIRLKDGKKLQTNDVFADLVVHKGDCTHEGIHLTDFPYAEYDSGEWPV